MCDKKNSVLFNDTECIVLSPNFKLTNESQVLLKVPRKNNMYSVDLKNIVPKGGLTCLFAKATSDESKLWHRRLGHINFKTMNKLIKGNLVRGLPSKLFENNQTCIACQKGKQHRAYYKSKTGRIVMIKRLHDNLEVTTAKVCVTAAKLKLVMFINSNEKYAKCLTQFELRFDTLQRLRLDISSSESYVANIKGKKNGRMMLESIVNGPLIYPTIEENSVIRPKKYAELTEQEKLQDDCDVQAINVILQGLSPDVYSFVNHCLVVPVFLPGDDLIACLNKSMAFMSTVVASRFPSTNNQLRTFLIQETKLLFRMAGLLFNKFKGDKESGQVLDEERLAFLADPQIPDGQAIQTTILQNDAFETDDLDAYDSDCDDISSAKAVLIDNLSSYGLDVLSETEQLAVTQTPIEIEVLKELLTVFNKEVIPFINSIRASFEDFENGLYSELNEVKTVFNQMESAVEQCSVDKKYFDIQNKELSLDNDRLLDHIICQDVMNIVMHDNYVPVNVLSANHKCLVDGNLQSERLKQENDHLFELLLSQDIVHICVNSLATLTNYAKMEQDYCNTPKIGSQRNVFPGALLHNTIAQV
ncbi:putative ribonuclease H-like domain-containing protein, partial [Tanacetum coccineum]